MSIVEQAYAKINLVLDVLGKRDDGFHEVKMIMQTVDLCDVIKISTSDSLKLTVVGADLPADSSNIAFKAAGLMAYYAKKEPNVLIELEKKIPLAAGLAGGSADAAAVLRGLNRLWQLEWPPEKLEQIAAELGSDVPFCVQGGTALATGRGEILTRLSDCPSVFVVIAYPEIEVSTAWVYKNFSRALIVKPPNVDFVIEALKRDDLLSIIDYLNNETGNVLESVTVKAHPIVNEIKQKMLSIGAKASLMSGSGPSVFGLVFDEQVASKIAEAVTEKFKAKTFIAKTRGLL